MKSEMLRIATGGLGPVEVPTSAGELVTAEFDLGIMEPFFAVTLPRKFPHPALAGLLRGQVEAA